MDFYDKVDAEYLNVIARPLHLWRVKLELLDHNENTIKCIEQDIDYSNAGNITCNNTQGTRKSCSITLINVDLKYIPTEDSPFWFNRKFRLFLGIVDNRHYKNVGNDWTNETDVYWFTKGVYITSEIHVDSTAHTVSISGVDKFAQLDGTLNVLQADEMNTVFEYGSPIVNVIKDILSLDMGNGLVLDPVTPIIDTTRLNSVYLYKEFTLSAGQYYGDFLNELATSYGAEVYYDNIGRLNFARIPNDDFPYWIGFRAPVHEFKAHLTGYQNPQETVKLTGINKIIVATDNVETPNASYTAVNNNPRSPLCFGKIGARTLPENGGVVIINAGNIVDEESQEADPTLVGESSELVTKRCRDYAEYRLMQETCLGTSITFNCPPYLHLNEGDIISITDPDFGLDCDLYIINSITFPLGANELSLEVSNLGFLNSDILSVSQFSTVANQPVKFGIHYMLNGGTGTQPANQLVEAGETFTTATDYDETNYSVSFSKENCEMISWVDNINGSSYIPNAEYTIPNQHFTLTANWKSYADYIMELRIREVAGAGYYYGFSNIANQYDELYEAAFIINNGRKKYYLGRNFETQDRVLDIVDTSITVKFCYVPIEEGTVMSLNGNQNSIIASGTNGGKTYYVKYPDAVNSLTLSPYGSYIETIILPKNIRDLSIDGGTPSSLKNFYFNNQAGNVNVTFGTSAAQSQLLCDNNNLQTVTAESKVTCYMYDNNRFLCSTLQNPKVPSIDFPKGLNIRRDSGDNRYVLYFDYAIANDTLTTIHIGTSDNPRVYSDGLELERTTMMNGSFGANIQLELGNVDLQQSVLCPLSIGRVQVSGDIRVNNNSRFLSTMNFLTDATLDLTGAEIYVNSSKFLYNNNLYNLTVRGNVTCINNFTFIDSLPLLTFIKFYGAVSISMTDTTSSFICENDNLTDVYFYNDNFTVTNTASNTHIFENNNANLKVHGIANGNVQAYCTAHSIPFEVISDE